MPFEPVDPRLDLVEVEKRVQHRWRSSDVIARLEKLRADGEPWVFYEGPPTANGRPGLHHVWARVFKDVYPRFQTMSGRSVPRKGGWDCHGLPVELEVEKSLGLHTKRDIEAYGIERFNARCRASVEQYVGDWEDLTMRSGVWIDTENAYWTLDNSYVESVWWLLRTLWDRGLLYEGHRVVPYCGRCGTALSSHEVAQGYADVTDASVYVRFPVQDGPEVVGGADLVVWTTTPWTLLSNTAAAVGADIAYVRVAAGSPGTPDGRDLVMAEAARVRLFPDSTVVARFTGDDLVGTRYERPFDDLDAPVGDDGWKVVTGDFVSTEDGSGIVHLAPAFGADDARVAGEQRLPILNPVDAKAEFTDQIPRFAGQFVKDTDRRIIDELRAAGLLVSEVPYTHSYPHCWRCGTPLIYWASTSWFARTEARRDELVAQNETVTWYPDHIKHGRFGRWLEGNVDWALSRDRYWGTPLPIWRCGEGHDTCIGSVAELAAHAGRDLSDLDLHRPAVDEVTFPCPHDGCDAVATRIEPVLDAWFDSGSMPTAQQHFPFASTGDRPDAFPADFICEAIDQTRGWFYSLLAVNTLALDAAPYRNVVCLGHIVDADGQKMSKSRGNIIDPYEIFDTLGADALRWYFFSAGQPWSPRRVFTDGINEATRRTLLTLWNCVSFFTTYAHLDDWTPTTPVGTAPQVTHVLDRWISSELDRCIDEVTTALSGFDALAATETLTRFVDDLSNWYLRRSRARFWNDSDPSAYATLHHCLVRCAQLFAPFCPHLADEIWLRCTTGVTDAADSVHLTDWPSGSGRFDAHISAQMAAARRLVALGRAARSDAGAKVRQPLRRALLLHPGIDLDPDVALEIAGELNVHDLEQVDTVSDLLSWTVVANFAKLGPRLGSRVNEIAALLRAADGDRLHDELERTGRIEIGDETLTADEVELRATRHESFALTEDNGWAVALDLVLDDELRSEGLARELTRALNEERKRLGLAISDRVRVAISTDDEAVTAMLREHHTTIAGEALAVELTWSSAASGTGHRITVDETPIDLVIAPVTA
jgi:isoleucyl-tRNA synthetase